MVQQRVIRIPVLMLVLFLVLPLSLRAQTEKSQDESHNLRSHLERLLDEHERIRSFAKRVQSAESLADQVLARYYPSLDLSADAGRERIDKEFGDDTVDNRYDVGVRLTQLIIDFGETSGAIQKAALQLDRTWSQLESVQQEVLLDGLKAYINVLRARERLNYALRSEERIKDLTGIESLGSWNIPRSWRRSGKRPG